MENLLLNYQNSKFPRNKEDLLKYAEVLKKRLDVTAKKDSKHPYVYYQGLIELADEFLSDIKNEEFASLDGYWVYAIRVRENGIEILERKLDENMFESNEPTYYAFTTERLVFKTFSKMFTVPEYASEAGEKETSILQNLRRGKYPSAIKVSNNWYIPQLTLMMSENKSKDVFTWNNKSAIFSEEFKFLKEYNSVEIKKDTGSNFSIQYEYNSNIYDDPNEKKPDAIIMSSQDKEKLMLYLTSNQFVTYQSNILLDITI